MNLTFKTSLSLSEISPQNIVETILKNREIVDIPNFLNPASPLDLTLHNFGYEKELKKTLVLLQKMKNNNGTIVVYTDYDADGITGGSIVWETLHLLGFHVMPYVPHRIHEGYGFSIKGIDAIKEKYNPDLIISVDHGITASEKITYAKSIGIQVIVTDHHLRGDTNPDDAVAIFHIPQLSGSGVGYFFSKAIFDHFKSEIKKDTLEILQHNFKYDYASLASIGTIADLVPLVGHSRSLVKHGLTVFSDVKRVGIKQLLEQSGIGDKQISPYEIGFVIAPRINAIGRLEHALDALRLLCTTNETKAYELATKVGQLNVDRQNMVKIAVTDAINQVEELQKKGTLPNIIVLVNEAWHEGIIGLIASKIVEKYHRPTLVITNADGFYKGSARSISSFHIIDFLKKAKGKYVIEAGGHKQAAGFRIDKNKIQSFQQYAEKIGTEQITDEALIPLYEADINMPLKGATVETHTILSQLQPFGIGNSEPSFFAQAQLVEAKIMGKQQNHLKIMIKDDSIRQNFEIVAFNKAELFPQLSKGMDLELIYKLDVNTWNGTTKPQGKLVAINLD
ncbi:MAG: single-stranded-DNA-specific exonuclease RecJ [Candidatus Roizmanbacteria bacterium]